MSDEQDVVLARIDQRLITVEREVKEIKAQQTPARAPWPTVLSSIAATGALVITLINMA